MKKTSLRLTVPVGFLIKIQTHAFILSPQLRPACPKQRQRYCELHHLRPSPCAETLGTGCPQTPPLFRRSTQSLLLACLPQRTSLLLSWFVSEKYHCCKSIFSQPHHSVDLHCAKKAFIFTEHSAHQFHTHCTMFLYQMYMMQ